MVKSKGFLVVLLSRLAIFPPNLVNYVLSITSVSVWAYMIGTFLGLIPGTIVLVFIGASTRRCSCGDQQEWIKIVFWVTLSVTFGRILNFY